MAKTMQERFILALQKLGELEIKRTHKRIVYTRKAGGYYYIGKSGSLRIGQTSVSSVPVNESFKKILLESIDNI